MNIKNVKKLIAKLKAKADGAASQPKVSVVVGFTATYALYVHENLEAIHPNGEAKFLENAANSTSDKVASVIEKAAAAGKPLEQCLLLGGLIIQADAQKRCPVDTGALKGSAFTRLDKQ